MSKISGIDIGDPNKPFQVYGSQLGGRDAAIQIQRADANIHRHKIEQLTSALNAQIKEIRSAVQRLEVMKEMIVIDEETDSVTLDKAFVDEYEQNIKKLKDLFDEILITAQK